MYEKNFTSSPIQTEENKCILSSDHISFIKICSSSPYLKVIENTFTKMISPVYGDQNSAVAKLKEGKDRTCEVMLKYDNPVGIIVYKNILQNEYGLSGALELKTLFLFNPEKNSGNGYGSMLFQRIDNVAIEMGTLLIYCTA